MSQGDPTNFTSLWAENQTTQAADDYLSQQSGRESTSTSPTASVAQSGTMDLVLSELQQTIAEAEAYKKQEQQHVSHLRSHISALREDCEMVTTMEPPDAEMRALAAKLVFQARRLKRHLERDAIDLEIKQNEQNSQAKLTSDDAEKSTSLKLAPLKLPEFNGDSAQFLVFKSFFEENILQNGKLTDTTKWLRLKECLTGPPAELISDLPQTTHSLTVAWRLLLDVYGGDEKPIVDLYDRLQRLPVATNATTSLRMTHSKLEGILMSLEHLGHDIESNQFIRWVVLSKFPAEVMYFVPQAKSIKLTELRKATADIIANREAADLNRTGAAMSDKPRAVATKSQSSRVTGVATDATVKPAPARAATGQPKSCVFCAAEHWNDQCPAYTSINVRKTRIAGRCLKCFRTTHPEAPCVGRVRCFHCDSLEHNRALCPTKFPLDTQKTVALATISQKTEEEVVPNKSGYFLTFVATVKTNSSREGRPMRIVVDTAGGRSLIRKKAALELGLKSRTSSQITFTGLDGAVMAQGSQLESSLLLQTKSGEEIEVQASVVQSIAQDVVVPDLRQFYEDHPEFRDYEIPPTGEGDPIDILVGSDVIVDVLLPEKIIYINANMLLMPTKFGWLLLGRKGEPHLQVCHTTILFLENNPIKLMTGLDLVGLQELHSTAIEEEQKAIRHFYSTVTWDDGRYSISWPWKTDPPLLDSNYGLALGRLRTLHKKLQGNQQLLDEYHGIIQKQLQDGIIEKVDGRRSTSQLVHYLPHHPVLQPEKSTTVRPVYDGAAKTGPGKLSLNENILKGTKWLNDLAATLIRFRRYKTVAISDIAKAFHQIGINEGDRDVVRFVWLRNHKEPPVEENLQIYRFTRVAFGIIASPFILHATINYHATQQQPSEFTSIILKDLYADNLVVALNDSIQPRKFYDHAKQFFSGMSMNLTKWTTNNEDLRRYIPEDDRLEGDVQNVLGIRWVIGDDTIGLKPVKPDFKRIPTRRTVAKQMAEFFDPMGWAVPILHTAKAFFRRIWELTEKWDEELSEADADEWREIYTKLQEMNNIKLPRFVTAEEPQKFQLHTFVDASKQAYAVVTYLRVVSGNQVRTAIIAAKNRLTPKKQVSIPKLEFVAAILGCRFTKFVQEALELHPKAETFIWTDSKCVVAWMTQKRILPPIIQNYVQKAKVYEIDHVRYVPSEANYADVATRGATFDELRRMNWWGGPAWLHDETEWPPLQNGVEPETESALLFCKQIQTVKTVKLEKEVEGIAAINIQNYSTLSKLLKVTVNVFRAVELICKKKLPGQQADMNTQEAQRRWLAWDQRRIYRLQGEPEAEKPFKQRGIEAFRDDHGLIRCRSCMQKAGLSDETVNPILLVEKSTLTKLIILYTHEKHYHAGTSHTLANVRKQFWLPQGRREVYWTILHSCYSCRRHNAKPYPVPPPKALPEFRVQKTKKPFQVVGLDIFGPMQTRTAPGREQTKQKVWGLLFTCAVVRAIHIEMLEEMTTEEVSLAFCRFVARRAGLACR